MASGLPIRTRPANFYSPIPRRKSVPRPTLDRRLTMAVCNPAGGDDKIKALGVPMARSFLPWLQGEPATWTMFQWPWATGRMTQL